MCIHVSWTKSPGNTAEFKYYSKEIIHTQTMLPKITHGNHYIAQHDMICFIIYTHTHTYIYIYIYIYI